MRLIRMKEVTKMTGLSRSYVYKLMNAGQFPKSVPLGYRCAAWVESEVEDWVLEKISVRDEGNGRVENQVLEI